MMDYTLHILLLSLACARAYQQYEPYGVLLQPRAASSRTALPADLLDEYEPYAYAAMPMPAMQVLHVVSPPQPQPARRRRRPAPRPAPRPEPAYSEEQSYEQEAADDATVLVYARPNRHGGYTYRRPSLSAVTHASVHASAPAHVQPFVVRIHKYKLNTDR